MKSEKKGDDDQNSLSKEERKQKKEERRKKKKERLKEKQNSTDVEQSCEGAAKNTPLDVVTESSKKKHKRKKNNSDSVDDIDGERKTGEHINGSGKIKRQKTEDIEQITNTNCDSSLVEISSKKTKRKKEKTVSIDSSYDTNQLPEVSQDITQSAQKKNKKHKKSRAESADGENVMPAKIDGTLLQMDSDIIHEKKSKKQNQRIHHSTNEEIEDTKHTDSKENNSSPTKEEHSKKKKEKHSKHRDCEPIDETDSNISRKKHKKKSKSASCICGNDEVQGNTDEHSMKSQDINTHATSDLNISNTGDEQLSKHKIQKNRSKNSPTASIAKNSSGKEQLCNEISECSKPTSDQMIKSEQRPACATATLGNWQGNLFESSERQNKFMRLLGGMKKSNDDPAEKSKDSATLAGTKKKGLFGSLASLSSTASSGSSAALDVTAAASLNQKLEDQYNKALNFKLRGKVGTGFGFVPDPAQSKTFHIDVNKSKSVKFDDD